MRAATPATTERGGGETGGRTPTLPDPGGTCSAAPRGGGGGGLSTSASGSPLLPFPRPAATHSQLLALAEKVARMMSSKERRKYSGLILEGRQG